MDYLLHGWDVMTPSIDADQTGLVRRIAHGDRTALAELYSQYRQTIYQYLLHLTPDYGLAEEILQDTMLAVWHHAATYEGRSSLRTWLIGIARRRAHDILRRHHLPMSDDAALVDMPSPEPDPADALITQVTQDEINQAINKLSPLHREILALVFINELSYQDIAEVLFIPVGTVKSRLANARRHLRLLLDHQEGQA